MPKYIDEGGLTHLLTLIKNRFASKDEVDEAIGDIDVGVTGVKGNSESTYRKGNVNLTAANIGAAASSHSHGNITSGGDITSASAAVSSGDKIIINDESASKIANGPAFGTDTTKYLRNDGSWATPPDTDTNTTYTLGTSGSGTTRKVTLTPSEGSVQSVDVPDTNTTYSDFTGATANAAGTHGLVPAPSQPGTLLAGTGEWITSAAAVEAGMIGLGLNAGNEGYFWTDGQGGFIVVDDGNLMTDAEKTKLAGIEDGANDYTHPAYTAANAAAVKVGRDATGHVVIGNALTYSDVGAAPTGHASQSDTYGKGTGSSYGHVKLSDSTSSTSAASSGVAASPKAVKDALDAAKAYADDVATEAAAGALVYKGTVAALTDITNTSYNKGWYWVASAAFTIGTVKVEVGDMIIAKQNKTSTAANDLDVVQSNIDALTTAEIDTIWNTVMAA